ncbi:MAG: aminotransferase class I/II-fold pyridoxal phosphate-dependent enzyme, partial [Candidatus Nitrotoga sp.]
LDSPRIIYMATLGKAAGVSGAFVAAEQVVIDTFLQTARSYIYTTASPPALASALIASLGLIEKDDWRRTKLQKLIAQLRAGLQSLPWKLLPSDTPVQPLIIGENNAVLELSDALRGQGIWIPAIRPPTVPPGTARLRISLSAAHSTQDVAQLITTLHDFAR